MILFGVGSFHAFSPAVLAAVWSLSDDFSTTQNNPIPWAYGYLNGANSFSLMETTGNFSNIDFWYHPGTGLPSIGHNGTGNVQDGSNTSLGPGETMLHPGDNAGLADLAADARWSAPNSGSYEIDANITGVDARGLGLMREE